MAYTEVTSQGWLGRLGNSCVGILIGLVMVLVSVGVLFWNEGRALHMAQSLAEGKGAVVPVSADKVDASNEGKLVHVSGPASAGGELEDPDFMVAAPGALRLRRVVEMYQWEEDSKRETRKKLGGGEETVTTYSYSKVWSSRLISSTSFKETGHGNPSQMPFPDAEEMADPVRLGAFVLGRDLTGKLDDWQALPVKGEAPEDLDVKLHDGGFYKGADPANPKIGDARVRFQIVPAGDVSLVAVQAGDSFRPYVAQRGGNQIFEIVAGRRTAQEMFADLEHSNEVLTWALRGGGFLLMTIGLALVMGPLSVFADVIPILGNFVGCATFLIAMALAAAGSLVTIAIGWLAYRPLVGIAMLVGAAVCLGAAVMLLRRRS